VIVDMGKFKFISTPIEGVFEIESSVLRDQRGYFLEIYNWRDTVEFAYKCDGFYHPDDEKGFAWNDLEVAIKWPLDDISQPLLSEKDAKLPFLVRCE